MPSITYIEENGSDNNSDNLKSESGRNTPEPPTRFDANKTSSLPPQGSPSTRASEFASTKRLVTIAQVMAIVSLLIGGVLLGTAALIVALVASSRVRSHQSDSGPEAVSWQSLKRSTTIAIVVTLLALAANIAALVIVYPMVIEAMQSGEYGSLLSGSAQMPGNTGTSTWG